jgi:hypothetical protein
MISNSSFFLDKKRSKKVKEKRMLRLFSGPTHKDSDNLKVVFGFEEIVANLAACYATTLEALLFRPPPKSSPVRGGLSSVGNYCEKRGAGRSH